MTNVCTSNFMVKIFFDMQNQFFIFSHTKKVYHIYNTSKPVKVLPAFMEAQ